MPHAVQQLHQCGMLLWCLTINFWKKVIIKPPDEHQSDDTTSAPNTDMRYSYLQQVNFMKSPLLWCEYTFLTLNLPSQQPPISALPPRQKMINFNKERESLVSSVKCDFVDNLFFKDLPKYTAYILTHK